MLPDGAPGGVLILGGRPSNQDIGKPFSSKSGQIYRRFADALFRPTKDFTAKIQFDYATTGILDRINASKPKVIITCGSEALRALTDHYENIEDVHCYVLRDSMFTDAPIVPTFAANDIMQQPTNFYWVKFAFQKAKYVVDGAKDKPMNLLVNNTYDQAISFIAGASLAKEMTLDIETNKFNPELSAIGISFDGDNILSISNGDGLDDAQFQFLVGKIIDLINDPKIDKIGQNIMFDLMMLWKAYPGKVKPAGKIWDTMHAANVINSEIEKSLKALGRLYFYGAPWKGGWNSTGEKLRTYNAQDVGFTHRIASRQAADLERLNLSNYFNSVPRALFLPSFYSATRGIRLDGEAKAKMLIDAETALAPIETEVVAWAKQYVPPGQSKRKLRDAVRDTRVTGDLLAIPEKERKEYYVAKKKDEKFGLTIGQVYKKAYREEIVLSEQPFNVRSSKQLLGILTNTGIKIPKVKKSNAEWGESSNDKALAKIIERGEGGPEVVRFCQNMRLMRAGQKLITSYLKAPLDEDGRWRCTYNIEGTETGRSSTKKTPWATGGNNQNIPRGGFAGLQFKRLFIADEGRTLFQSDQEQAEARVVAYLSGCKKLIELFEEGKDIHTYAISSILGEDVESFRESKPEHFKTLRQYGKIVNHGGNYDMGATTLSENAIKQGILLDPKQAESFLNKRKQVFPEIYEVWHEGIKAELHKNRVLTTPFGRRRVFMGPIMPSTYREAYAFVPQSTIPHITNLMWLWADPRCEVLQMGHDALLVQVPCDKLNEFAGEFIEQTKKITFKIGDREVNIPWDAQTGNNWAELKKWHI